MKKQTKNRLGRSMTEMLMTLAIIGVLSVASVIGLRMAFVRHKVNLLIEDIKMAGFVVVDGIFDGMTIAEKENDHEIELTGKFIPQSPYTFTAFRESVSTFAVVANDVPYNVCEQVKTKKVNWLEEIKPNGEKNICYEDQDNNISFFFNVDLNGNTEVKNPECRTAKDCPNEKKYCNNGYCEECQSDNDCPETKQYCRNGYCTGCDTGLQSRNGECEVCPEGGTNYVATTENFCHACGKNYFFGRNFCHKCSSGSGDAEVSTKAECRRCPNRCWDEEQGKCVNSIKGNYFNNNGICRYSCPPGQFIALSSGSYQCTNCPAKGTSVYASTTKEQCHNCGDNVLLSNENFCRECSFPFDPKNATPDECKRCKNRYYNQATEECLLCDSGMQATEDGFNCE